MRRPSAPEVRTYGMSAIDQEYQLHAMGAKRGPYTIWYNREALDALRHSIAFANRIPARKFYAS